MKKVLVITNKWDLHTNRIIQFLEAANITVFRYNTEDNPRTSIRISLVNGSEKLILRNKKRSINIDEIGAVYYRRPEQPEFTTLAPTYAEYLQEEHGEFLKHLYAFLSHIPWLNDLESLRRANSKLLQLRLAARVGLKTPATLVTNQREELIEFYHKHEGNIIAKPFYRTFVESDTGYDTILTSKVSRDDLKKNNCLELTPVIFQEYIEKMYELRVTCVGDNVFAAKIDSQASEKTRVDWRNYDFEKVRHTAYDLPVHIKDRCLDLSKELGLKYGAMDFIVTPNNEYVFLENNPNGQWLWIENLTDLPISLSIANEICELLSPRRSL